MREPPPTQAVDRALRLLSAFPRDRGDVSLSELSRSTRMDDSTVLRLLRTLERHGFVSRNPLNRRYSLGLRLFELGRVVADGLDVRWKALPAMQRLSEMAGETIYLFLLADGEAVCVEKVEPRDTRIRTSGMLGTRVPLHAGAAAKLLLAFLPEAEIQESLRRPLPRYTANTITSPDRLRTELKRIRAHGYAVSRGERTVGLTAIAAPIRDHMGSVVAALTLDGPSFRLPPNRVQELTTVITATADEVSSELGYAPDRTVARSGRDRSA